MKKFIGKRLLQLVIVLFGITLLTFILMNTSKTDAIDMIEQNTGTVWTEEQKAEMRSELGLDKPVLERYGIWLFNLLKGDMGTSYITGNPVLPYFMSKLPATILLMLSSIILTLLISIPLGILAATHQNKFFDYLIRVLSFIGNALPGFFLALLLIFLFAVKLNWLSITGFEPGFESIILPTLTLSIAMSAKYTRQVRAVFLEELNKDYVLAARARGIKERTILYFDVLKSSILSIVTLLALSIGSLLGGTAVVETIFMWDGVGKLAVDSIMSRDYPVIQAYVIWMAVIYVFINLITDILYHYIDPRVRLGEKTLS